MFFWWWLKTSFFTLQSLVLQSYTQLLLCSHCFDLLTRNKGTEIYLPQSCFHLSASALTQHFKTCPALGPNGRLTSHCNQFVAVLSFPFSWPTVRCDSHWSKLNKDSPEREWFGTYTYIHTEATKVWEPIDPIGKNWRCGESLVIIPSSNAQCETPLTVSVYTFTTIYMYRQFVLLLPSCSATPVQFFYALQLLCEKYILTVSCASETKIFWLITVSLNVTYMYKS